MGFVIGFLRTIEELGIRIALAIVLLYELYRFLRYILAN
jgi:hypothetical protein